MHLDRVTVRESAYLGVFCSVTDALALVPNDISKKELANIKAFDVEIIRAKVADSCLFGVLMRGAGNKFVVPDLLNRHEEDFFSSKGIELLKIGNKAYGNLMAMNSRGGMVSGIVERKDFEKIKAFFGIHLIHSNFSCTELIGSSIVASDKGFIVNPEISQEEFSNLSCLFGVKGKATTANYGDIFVGNDVIANSNAVFVGSYTTAKEIMHIDEGLRGE